MKKLLTDAMVWIGIIGVLVFGAAVAFIIGVGAAVIKISEYSIAWKLISSWLN